jgi:hypothetical protein
MAVRAKWVGVIVDVQWLTADVLGDDDLSCVNIRGSERTIAKLGHALKGVPCRDQKGEHDKNCQ